MYDVIIVGGGPAGLSAALMLGRARRRVLVCDHGRPRNMHARALHGYLSRDGISPGELLKLGRAELVRYGVEFRQGEVIDARRVEHGFELYLHDGNVFQSRKLLLATGMRDQLPRVEGLTDLYGKSVHHCPYCDGWEWRDRRLAAYGHGKPGLGLALLLRNWSDDVVVLTNGTRGWQGQYRAVIESQQLPVYQQKIARLEGCDGMLQRVVFEDGSHLERDALFFNTGQRQKSDLAAQLGCEFDKKGGVVVDSRARTGVPGLYLCGDASRDVEFVVVAAAEGAAAAITINKEFQEEAGRVI